MRWASERWQTVIMCGVHISYVTCGWSDICDTYNMFYMREKGASNSGQSMDSRRKQVVRRLNHICHGVVEGKSCGMSYYWNQIQN